MQRLLTFNIPGRAMTVIQGSSLYESPDAGDPDEQEASRVLQRAEWQKRGAGETYFVVCPSRAAASVIQDYCAKTGAMLRGSSDEDTQRDSFALLVVADRIEMKLRETE